MNLTSKSRYAFKIMIDLAVRSADAQVERGAVVAQHGIPATYMDQILLKLKNAGLVVSNRGRKGGYRLARAPETISVYDIVAAVEDTLEPVQCLVAIDLCEHQEICVSKGAWHHVFEALKLSMTSLTLESLLAAEGKVLHHSAPPVGTIIECRPSPSRTMTQAAKERSQQSFQTRVGSDRRSLV